MFIFETKNYKGTLFSTKCVELYHICMYIYAYTEETHLRGFACVSCAVFCAGQELDLQRTEKHDGCLIAVLRV